MSNIGYAVFGSPKGIAVVSNGLFKSLNLDKSLYLNNSHVILENGERALMIRRIPSSMNNLERKDALLVVLYENALQHGENRPGGFVGSALCFKNNMPKAEKIISGLLYLFSKMKANVDEDNRFKTNDSSNWNISLPDANKEFGLEDNKLTYSPISASSKNIAVKLNNLEKESASLLYNFALNRSFHSVDYLYASTSNTVIKKMVTNGFLPITFGDLFNYDKHLSYYKDKLVSDNSKLSIIKKEASTLQDKIFTDSNQVKRLELEISSKISQLEKIDKDILEEKNRLDQAIQKKREVQRESDEISRSRNNNFHNRYTNLSSEDSQKVEELKTIVSQASKKIKKYANVKYKVAENLGQFDKDKKNVEYFFEEMPKRKSKTFKRNISILSILTILLLTFVVLFIIEYRKLNDSNEIIEQFEKKDKIIADKIEVANKKEKEFLDKLKKFQKGNTTADYKEFKKLTDDLLKNHLKNKYNVGSDEFNFIDDHKWEFWEFDYTDDALVNRLNPNSKATYFITLENEIKPLNKSIKWKENIDELLDSYLKEPNDIYQDVNREVLKNEKILKEHFKWVIEKSNGKEIGKIAKNEKIGLPYFKK